MTPRTREQLLAELVARLDAATVLHSQGRVADAEEALSSASAVAEVLGLPRRTWGQVA